MKKLALLPLVLVLLALGLIVAFNAGVFHSNIQARVAAAAGAQVALGRMRLAYSWPPTVHIASSRVDHPLATVDWNLLTVQVRKLSRPYQVHVTLREPKVALKEPPAGQLAPQAAAPSGGAGAPAQPLGLELTIRGGQVDAMGFSVRALDLDFVQKQLLKSPASVNLAAQVKTPYFPAALPVQLNSESLTLSQDSIKSTGLNATVAGLRAAVQGASLLGEGRHRWLLNIHAPDLKALPVPPNTVPVKSWSGSVQAKVELSKATAAEPWAASGEFAAREVLIEAAYRDASGLVAEGPVAATASGQFLFEKGRLSVPEFRAHVDVAAAKVVYPGWLEKSARVPMNVLVEAAGTDQTLAIKVFKAQVWNAHAEASGRMSLLPPFVSELKVSVPPVALKGLEALVPHLRKSPVDGEVAAVVDFSGPLMEPMQAKLNAPSFRVRGFKAEVDYDGASVKLKGPVAASIEGTGQVAGGQLVRVNANGQADLTGAAVVAGPLRKEARQELSLLFAVANTGQMLSLTGFDVRGFLGRVRAQGQVQNPLTNPDVNLNLTLQPLNLSELRIAMPEFRDQIPKGELRAALSLRGSRSSDKPWHDWPLTVSGDVNVKLPEYKMAATEAGAVAAPGGKAAGAVAQPAPAFLPKGALTQQLNVQVAAEVARFVKDDLVAGKISVKGLVRGGRFSGDVRVGEVFAGQAQVTALNVPLLEARPTLQGTAQWTGIDTAQALAFAKPDMKDMASGKTMGKTEFSTYLPGDPQFMDALKARGEAVFEPMTLNSVKLGEIINDMLKKLPVQVPPAKVEPLQGMAKVQFELAAQTVTLPSFFARDKDGNELQMKGKVLLAAMTGDLLGTFFWVNPPVKGCLLEGNSDAQGRMLVPLAIKGPLMNPGVSMVSDVAAKIAGRALECEGKKLLEKAKQDGGKQLQKEAGKLLKGILGK